MDPSRFNVVSTLFAARRLTRRQAMVQGGVGLAAGALAATGRASASAQDATPEAAGATKPEFLFLQSFRAGSVAPKEGEEGRYTVTLEHGLGQTIYFSDRPDRIVGASPTPQFLEGLGFPEDNPPNAALVMETAEGETDIAVVELFNPVYDDVSHTATYEVAVLESWEESTELGFSAAPSDLAALAPSFGAAHLFIDGCPNRRIGCADPNHALAGTIPSSEFGGFDWAYGGLVCLPHDPWIANPTDATAYWSQQCNDRFPSKCNGFCSAQFNLL